MTAVLAFDCAVTGLAVAVVRDEAVLANHRSEEDATRQPRCCRPLPTRLNGRAWRAVSCR
jgi:hypothetical protein